MLVGSNVRGTFGDYRRVESDATSKATCPLGIAPDVRGTFDDGRRVESDA